MRHTRSSRTLRHNGTGASTIATQRPRHPGTSHNVRQNGHGPRRHCDTTVETHPRVARTATQRHGHKHHCDTTARVGGHPPSSPHTPTPQRTWTAPLRHKGTTRPYSTNPLRHKRQDTPACRAHCVTTAVHPPTRSHRDSAEPCHKPDRHPASSHSPRRRSSLPEGLPQPVHRSLGPRLSPPLCRPVVLAVNDRLLHIPHRDEPTVVVRVAVPLACSSQPG